MDQRRRGENVREDVERIDELEFLARVVTQLPEPRKHSIRYYGYYAAVVRAKRRRAEAEAPVASSGNDAVGNHTGEARGRAGGVRSAVPVQSAADSEPDTAECRQLSKSWAALIRRVYEVDPLVCPCGATMRIVAVITERSVISKILAHLGKVVAESATEGAGLGTTLVRSPDGATPSRIGAFSSASAPTAPFPPRSNGRDHRNHLYFPRRSLQNCQHAWEWA